MDPELGSLERLVNGMKELILQQGVPNCRRRLDNMSNKRPFRTQEMGLYAMGPRSTQPGDVVVLFRGARTPYVLRPRGDMRLGYFELLGEAYLS